MLVLLLITITLACHPECTNGDEHVYPASCTPVCQPHVCTNTCDGCVSLPNCHVECPEDQCESDSCPACTLLCNTPVCIPDTYNNCTIECQQLQCDWQCVTPPACTGNCTCDAPACAHASSATNSIIANVWAVILVVYLISSTT